MTLDAASWPAGAADGQARRAALQAVDAVTAATSVIEYRSAGHLLIIGSPAQAEDVGRSLGADITVHVLIPEAHADPGRPDPERSLVSDVLGVGGHLGNFTVTVEGPEGDINAARLLRGGTQHTFDMVLDLQNPPYLQQDIPPAGYYAPRGDPARLQSALDELRELVGEFEKPKYFEYDAALCAHGRNGKHACRRCIDACPTIAIRSAGERIEVDPYLCQGGGSCATACPSGAITYAYPSAADMLAYVRGLLGAYHDAGGSHPGVLFYDRERGAAVVEAATAALPEHVLAIAVEEIGSVGMDCWLACLAFGAADVGLLVAEGTAPSVSAELQRQLEYCHAILSGLGIDAKRVALLQPRGAAELPSAWAGERREALCRAPFETFNEKRNTLFAALDRLLKVTSPAGDAVALPQGAPFGEVHVDAAGCTLCLACASACPANALLGGDETPRLSFIEAKCVQCGLCATTCPEQVIAISPRLLLNAEARRAPRTLHEEQPFRCLECGKPFATQKIIETMQAKLKDHWMFGDEAAMRRLELCDECRVKDLYQQQGGIGEVDRN